MQTRHLLFAAALVLMALVGIRLTAEAPGNRSAPSHSLQSSPPDHPRDAPGKILLPLPELPDVPAGKAALGERLFFDKRLSQDDSISCASCHDLARGGTDRLPVSIGIRGQRGQINAPTVFNASLNFVQFWDGRAATLAEQTVGPLHNPVEMGSNWSEIVGKLAADPAVEALFREAYPDGGLTSRNIVDAITSYERTLLTPGSRIDQYLRGDLAALNAQEQTGYRRFLDYGCASCHQGVGIGGNMFHRFGVMADYFRGRTPRTRDLGRFNVTGQEADRHVFKVPSLRNVGVTAPYFHDASAATLEEAVSVMGRYQLGRELSTVEVADIAAFLRTLTGQWQGKTLE